VSAEVAHEPKAVPFVSRHVIAKADNVQSPESAPPVMEFAPENSVSCPLVGEPVVVTVPLPPDAVSAPPTKDSPEPSVTAVGPAMDPLALAQMVSASMLTQAEAPG
jgi:hypothetical protein